MKTEQQSKHEEYLLQSTKLNVLLIEHDDQLADSIKIELQKYNTDVHRAENPEDALLILEGKKLDILIIEVSHPIIDAYHTINAMRSSRSNNNVPIVALVPNGSIDLLEPASRAGATNFLTKPIVWFQFHQLMQSMHWCMVDQRRKYRRVEVPIRVLIAFDDKKIVSHTIDIGAGGMLLNLDKDIPLDKQLAVTFPYVEDLAAPFLFSAQVVRIIDVSEGGKFVALEFLDVSSSQSERLLTWIDMFHYIDTSKIGNQLKA